MRYAILLNYPEMPFDQIEPKALEAAETAFNLYVESLDQAGVLAATSILKPVAETKTVTRQTGATVIQDGPFVDTRERLGGVFLIDVDDMDAALEWAEKAPSVEWGTVEVREAALTWDRGIGWH
jgi:hypothetical protein